MAKKLPLLIAALTLVVAACGGGAATETSDPANPASQSTEAPGGDAAAGETLYTGSCSACHAPDGVGVDGLGKPIVGSEFVASLSDQELVDFIKSGRSTSDPANTTGIDMPPKGGNPSLSDSDIADIAAYLRTIN